MQVKTTILRYVQELETRPKGYTRQDNKAGDCWAHQAWEPIVSTNKSAAYRLGVDMWFQAANLLRFDKDFALDYADTQEVSEQFYALYADILLESVRNLKE